MNIKAVALDVDGVLVGQRIGFNSPEPHKKVLSTLKRIQTSGVPVILVTAKLHHSIHEIILQAKLHGHHVADGGAILIDVLNNIQVVSEIEEVAAIKIIHAFIQEKIYTCFYTPEEYYIQSGQNDDFTRQNSTILHRVPVEVLSLVKNIKGHKITKIMPIVRGEEEKKKAISVFDSVQSDLVLHWAKNPMSPGLWYGFTTAPGISKLTGLKKILKTREVAIENVLGVGDSDSDLVFMVDCGFVAAMGNATDSLKSALKPWGNRGYIGPHVDENGVIDILNHFIKI